MYGSLLHHKAIPACKLLYDYEIVYSSSKL